MEIITHILAALVGAAAVYALMRKREKPAADEGPNVGIMTGGGPGDPPPPPGGPGTGGTPP